MSDPTEPEAPISLDEERKKRRDVLSLMTTVRTDKCYPLCRFVVDGMTRTIACEKCGRVVDPFDAMMDLANDLENYTRNREWIRRDIDRLTERLKELEASVKSLKGKERRLLKDSNLIARQIADWIEQGVKPRVKKEERAFLTHLVFYLREGEWRHFTPPPAAEGSESA